MMVLHNLSFDRHWLLCIRNGKTIQIPYIMTCTKKVIQQSSFSYYSLLSPLMFKKVTVELYFTKIQPFLKKSYVLVLNCK